MIFGSDRLTLSDQQLVLSNFQDEMLDYVKMNIPGNESYRVLAESVRRAIQLCEPLKLPTNGYARWKELILNFDARDMLGG